MDKILKKIFIGFVVVAIATSLHYLGWLKPVENFLVASSSQAQARVYNLAHGITSGYDYWLKKRNLITENQSLQAELAKYKVEQAQVNSLQEENSLLKKELNFTSQNKTKFVAAQIISGVSDPTSRSVVINKGVDDGLAAGMAVVADGGVMIGKISEVHGNFSKILLLTDNKSKVAATIQNENGTVGLVEGQFGLNFSMTNIPQNQEIKPDDFVVTSGLEGLIPKNLLIAQVENVNQVESEIFKTATLRPIISFDDLSYVLVVIP